MFLKFGVMASKKKIKKTHMTKVPIFGASLWFMAQEVRGKTKLDLRPP